MNKLKIRIVNALNTWMPALNILRKKGYKLFISPDHRKEFYGDFWAIRDGREFIASNPLELFGLIAIWEEYGDGDNWLPKKQKYVDIQDELERVIFPDDPYSDFSDDEFAQVLEYWSDFFSMSGEPLPATRQELYNYFNVNTDES
jgi:hypothetical protein